MSDTLKDTARSALQEIRATAATTARMEAFRQVYEKTDRILSGHPVRVIMEMNPLATLNDAPGWTDGKNISLNARVINRDLGKLPLPMIVLHTKAVNYHELGHIMMTPRMDSDVIKWVKSQQVTDPQGRWWYAFNALEDQRMEMLFTAKYRPAGNYFEAIVLKWIINNGPWMAESYILTYGRRFLPSALQASVRTAFVGKYGLGMTVRFEECINDYVGLLYPDGTLKAQKCILRYAQLINEMASANPLVNNGGPPTPSLPSDDFGGVSGPINSRAPNAMIYGAPKSKDQEDAKSGLGKVAPRAGKGDPDDDDTDDGDDDDSDEFTDGDGDGGDGDEAGESGDGDGDGQSGSEPASSAINGDAGDGSAVGGGAGSGGEMVVPNNAGFEALQEAYDALDELFKDQEFMKELEETASSVQSLMNGGTVAVGETMPSESRMVPSGAMAAQRRMSAILARLRTELEETRNIRQTAGGIDTKRFITRKPWETDFFRTYDPGMDESADLEAVIILDMSGSMSNLMQPACEALWTVKRAMEALDARVTVLGFNNGGYVLYQPTEKVDRTRMRVFGCGGGTQPDDALREAFRLLNGSRRTQRLLITITDGDWQGHPASQAEIVNSLNKSGTTTALIAIGQAPSNAHHHQVFRRMNDVRQMPALALDIVRESLKAMSAAMHSG